jgi:hypothetical protein
MELHILLGWDDEDAFLILQDLKIVPDQDPSNKNQDDFDPREFVVSDNGIRYIQTELDGINQRFGTRLEWRMYPDDNFVLVWEDQLIKSIGDPNDHPVEKFYIDHHYKSTCWRELVNHYDPSRSPSVITIIDSSEFYHKYIYSDCDSG